ncbi:MAG: DUF1801 domain-containing protein [Clostridia bacterium]|nr:DUF1801 domain-containing protein [Clostridia bacterium]
MNRIKFEKMINGRSETVKDIARAVRDKFFEIYPDVDETVWVRQKTSGYGIGPRKMSQHFGWIMTAKAHVNMGFNYGSSLPDPEHLLEGTGKNMRHIKIKNLSDLDNQAVDELVRAAVSERTESAG